MAKQKYKNTGAKEIRALKAEIAEVKNYVFPTPDNQTTTYAEVIQDDPKKDLTRYISPIQLQRLRHDILMWRDAVREMELAYFPQRVKVQRLYIDTILNGHVRACHNRRKRLTTLRDYEVVSSKDDTIEYTEVLAMLKKPWHSLLQEFALDAQGYGYSLIALGDCVNGEFPNIKIVKRWNTSPERLNVTSYIYSLSGKPFMEEPYCDWHIWVTTPNEHGTADCGYGYFYEVGQYEIILRNLLGFNGDFVELFAQPYRVGKTLKKEESERAELESALKNMGSTGYAVLDPMDTIEFLESKLGGTGFEGYDNLEKRCENKVSKLILGHSDAQDSVPGKIGSLQGGEESPVAQSLSEVQTQDGRFYENLMNTQVFQKLRNIGFDIPEDAIFRFKNDDEVEEFRRREDASNLETANIALLMKNANLAMDPTYFSDRTGIPCKPIAQPAAPGNTPGPDEQKQLEKVKAKLEKLYKVRTKI